MRSDNEANSADDYVICPAVGHDQSIAKCKGCEFCKEIQPTYGTGYVDCNHTTGRVILAIQERVCIMGLWW